eukprot:scaffold18231_cov112-Isochrysis_galbana.AAC.1
MPSLLSISSTSTSTRLAIAIRYSLFAALHRVADGAATILLDRGWRPVDSNDVTTAGPANPCPTRRGDLNGIRAPLRMLILSADVTAFGGAFALASGLRVTSHLGAPPLASSWAPASVSSEIASRLRCALLLPCPSASRAISPAPRARPAPASPTAVCATESPPAVSSPQAAAPAVSTSRVPPPAVSTSRAAPPAVFDASASPPAVCSSAGGPAPPAICCATGGSLRFTPPPSASMPARGPSSPPLHSPPRYRAAPRHAGHSLSPPPRYPGRWQPPLLYHDHSWSRPPRYHGRWLTPPLYHDHSRSRPPRYPGQRRSAPWYRWWPAARGGREQGGRCGARQTHSTRTGANTAAVKRAEGGVNQARV